MVTDPVGHEVTELYLHLLDDGRHLDLHRRLGAHPLQGDDFDRGVHFSLWAPDATAVSVVGDWNHWVEGADPLARTGGVWQGTSTHAHEGHRYKFAVTGRDDVTAQHADPVARRAEPAPDTASIVHRLRHSWADGGWMADRSTTDPWRRPMSVYEVHVGSWRRDPAEPERERGFREVAPELAAYAVDMGFTHVELLPVMHHPFGGSWGYQVTSLFAPAARWGTPEDLAFLIDTLHQAGVGVILDWVPAHFPRDEWALARLDGSALYEHPDPRRGEHPDWGTLVFDYGRGGVRSFLLSSALYWLEEFHVDGLRVDAVASMLYLDYSRPDGHWLPNQFGGRENLEAISLLGELNDAVTDRHPGVVTVAEESTAWPRVTAPTAWDGLGFSAKWNMGWMHDTLAYFSTESVHRRHHHHDLTFSLHYAFTERFVLALSHDEVVHEKRSLLTKMPGDRWQQFANLRALYGWMWAHPGKQLLFMGGEFAQAGEWDHDRSLDWHLLADLHHQGVQDLVRDLNRIQRGHRALWDGDSEPGGFAWLVSDDADHNVAAFIRWPTGPDADPLVCVANLSPVPRSRYPLGLPRAGHWREVLNTDSAHYGGSDMGNQGSVVATDEAIHGQPASARLTLPPFSVLWLEPT